MRCYCHRAYAYSSRWRGCSYCLHYTIGGAWKPTEDSFISVSLETTKQMGKIYFQHTVFFGALGL